MLEIPLIIFIIIVMILLGTIFNLNRVIKRQDERISDLLDRLTAPDFHTYQQARKEENQKIEVVKAEEIIQRFAEVDDGLRID